MCNKTTHIDIDTICKKGISFQRLIANVAVNNIESKSSKKETNISIINFKEESYIKDSLELTCNQYIN